MPVRPGSALDPAMGSGHGPWWRQRYAQSQSPDLYGEARKGRVIAFVLVDADELALHLFITQLLSCCVPIFCEMFLISLLHFSQLR